MEADDAASAHVNGEREPGPLDGGSGDAVHNDHIDERVIDLNERQRPRGLKCPDGRRIKIACGLLAVASRDNLPARLCLEPCGHRFTTRRAQACARGNVAESP